MGNVHASHSDNRANGLLLFGELSAHWLVDYRAAWWCRFLARVGQDCQIRGLAAYLWFSFCHICARLVRHSPCYFPIQVTKTKHIIKKFINLKFFFLTYRVIYTTTYEGPAIVGEFPAYKIFNGFLFVLQVLHIIWFYMICRVAYKAIAMGKVDKDDRSESDDSSINGKDD